VTLPFQGRTERRLALVILLTSITPLVVAVLLAGSLFKQASAIWFNPEVGRELDRGLDIYKDYVKAIKADMRHQTDAIAADEVLHEAARRGNVELTEAELDVLFPRFPDLVTLVIEDRDGNALARRDRGRPVDETAERSMEVRRSLAAASSALQGSLGPTTDASHAPAVVATFAVDRKRLDELEASGAVVAKYHQLETSRTALYQGYLTAYAVLVGITMLMTVILGSILARGVTRRVERLANAFTHVARGDLSVRVPVTGSDELTELAAVFNRMLGELEQSRARIEYLQRIGAWQEMAQRLAHEIKNPLTPIQLAVQECHRKYAGSSASYRTLLNTTLEIVEEEVGTLRRLVGTFSNFARMPHAELGIANVREFLHECSETLAHLEDESTSCNGDGADSEPLPLHNVDIAWDVPGEPLPAAVDRQMLRRVVLNLVRNAVQAIRGAHPGSAIVRDDATAAPVGHVRVSAEREGEGCAIIIEDDGPGIPHDAQSRIFDPYFTTKADGTGLGLAIVKKIVVEHGGRIDAGKSERLGGARFTLHLPGPGEREIKRAPVSAPRVNAPT
jgi:two-component system, NtrC family, nitrogen regulation sensor histidine kinase NtrY